MAIWLQYIAVITRVISVVDCTSYTDVTRDGRHIGGPLHCKLIVTPLLFADIYSMELSLTIWYRRDVIPRLHQAPTLARHSPDSR